MAEQWWYPGSGLGEGSFTSGPTASGWQPHNFCYGNTITVGGSTGTATAISARVDTGNTGDITLKLGLYDSSGNLLAQSSVVVPNGLTGTWRDVSISVTGLAPGTYRVLGSASTTNLRYYYNTGDNGDYATRAYASAMADPETINVGAETNLGYAVRVYVVEDAASTVAGPVLQGRAITPGRIFGGSAFQ